MNTSVVIIGDVQKNKATQCSQAPIGVQPLRGILQKNRDNLAKEIGIRYKIDRFRLEVLRGKERSKFHLILKLIKER